MATEDEQGRTLVDANMVGNKWQLVDTILPNDHAYLFPAGNGRVGDSDRPANVWIRDNGVPHDLTNETVSIWGLDAAGKVKIVDGYQDATDLAHGKITLMFPKQMYQANGDYRELWLQINNGDQVVSTINLHITVWQNNIIQTWSNSEDYISKIDNMLTSLTKTIQNKLTELTGDIQTAQTAANLAKTTAENMMQLVKDNSVLTFSSTGTFTKEIDFGTAIKIAGNVISTGDVISKDGSMSDIYAQLKGVGTYVKTLNGAWGVAFTGAKLPTAKIYSLSNNLKLVIIEGQAEPAIAVKAWSNTTIMTFPEDLPATYGQFGSVANALSGTTPATIALGTRDITVVTGINDLQSHVFVSIGYVSYKG